MTTLKVQKREVTGSRVRTLRRDGILPAVIYGTKTESINVQVKTTEFVKAFKLVRTDKVLTVDLDGTKYKVTIKDVDVHPVRGEPRHADLLIQN